MDDQEIFKLLTTIALNIPNVLTGDRRDLSRCTESGSIQTDGCGAGACGKLLCFQ